MAFRIYLKKEEGNDIVKAGIIESKIVEVSTLDYVAGSLKIGSYYLPLNNILFVKEV